MLGPDRRGLDARHPPGALTRVPTVEALHDRCGLALPSIRRELLLGGPDRLRAWAAEAAPGATPRSASASATAPVGTAAA